MNSRVLLLGIVPLLACREPVKTASIEITPAEEITTSTEMLCVMSPPETDEDNPLTITYEWTKQDLSVLADTDALTLTPEIVQPTDVLREGVAMPLF